MQKFATTPSSALRSLVAGVVVFATLLVGCSSVGTTTPSTTGAVYEVVVPAGTYESTMRGELIDLLPAVLDVKVGDTFVVVNQDKFTHTIGPFTVRPGETLRHVWLTPDTILGECSLLMGDAVTINVTA
jgi:uncharacterized protein YceK